MSSPHPTAPPETEGAFHYLDASMESTLYRNGQVRIDRDRDGSLSSAIRVFALAQVRTTS